MNVQTHVVGAGALSAELTKASIKVVPELRRITVYHGQMLQTKVKANASGRPGPNAPTGDYRRSISLQITQRGKSVTATVGTNKPQGRRLEYGFHGTDSLGRHYNQPPFPHFGPAMDLVGPAWIADIERMDLF